MSLLKIKNIIAQDQVILLIGQLKEIDALESITVKVFEPLAKNPFYERILNDYTKTSDEVTFSMPRYVKNKDMLYYRYKVEAIVRNEKYKASGVQFVTDFEFGVPNENPYPKVDSIKGLQVYLLEDVEELGLKHCGINLNLPSIARKNEGPNTITFEHEGSSYYFDKVYLDKFDASIKYLTDHHVLVNLILINSVKWDGTVIDEALRDILLHPDYVEDDPDSRISAFNVVTTEGYAYYRAFLEFIAQKYTRSDGKYGNLQGLIIGNEINSQWVWGNAGLKTVEAYVEEYDIALRTAQYALNKYYKEGRSYISLEHHWNMAFMDDSKKCYYGREMIDLLNEKCKEEGNYKWGIAFHPYPENLFYCDFWNDKDATPSFDTKKITFKNLEVLTKYLNQEAYLFKGQCRPITLSEQGFNSLDYTEAQLNIQAAAYCLAYKKVLECPDIQSFLYHAQLDNKFEFGLNLGIRKRDEHGNPTEKKPIFYAMANIDTDQQDQLIEKAKPYLKEQLGRADITVSYEKE